MLYRLMLCHITAGRATSVAADFLAKCDRWSSHVLGMSDFVAMMADGIVM